MHDSAKRRPILLPVLATVVLAASACGGSSSSTTLPSTTATSSTETFTGTIGRNGIAVHSFAVKSGGYTLLAGYTSITPASVGALGLGIGSWDSATSTCGLNATQNDAAKSGSTAISATAGAGSYCLRVYDGGNLAEGVTASYELRVDHY